LLLRSNTSRQLLRPSAFIGAEERGPLTGVTDETSRPRFTRDSGLGTILNDD
jgi:hypothetical protein